MEATQNRALGMDAGQADPPAEHSSAEIFALWDELADFPVGDGDAALQHLLSRLCTLFGAHNALWSLVVRLPSPASGDALNGWRPRLVRLLKPLAPIAASVQEQFDTLWSPSLDLSQILAVSGDEPFRTRLLFETLPPEWFESVHYKRHYLAVGHHDSISMRYAVNEDVRVHLFLFRSTDAPRFTAADKQPFGLALRGLRWFYRQQLLSHGLLVANTPLTAAERRVLLELLDGKTEKPSLWPWAPARTPPTSTSRPSTPSSASTTGRRWPRSGSGACLKPGDAVAMAS